MRARQEAGGRRQEAGGRRQEAGVGCTRHTLSSNHLSKIT